MPWMTLHSLPNIVLSAVLLVPLIMSGCAGTPPPARNTAPTTSLTTPVPVPTPTPPQVNEQRNAPAERQAPTPTRVTTQPSPAMQPKAKPAASAPPANVPTKAPIKPVPQITQTTPAPVSLQSTKPDKSQETPAEPNTPRPSPAPAQTDQAPLPASLPAPALKAPTVDLLALPLRIADWTLSLQSDASGADFCQLDSRRVQMEDGHGPTGINITLQNRGLLLQTDSNIDLTYQDTGLQMDERRFELETLSNPTTLIFTRQRDAMVAALQQATTVRATLGFWPTWPVTQPYSSTLPTAGFATAWQAWQDCNTQLNSR